MREEKGGTNIINKGKVVNVEKGKNAKMLIKGYLVGHCFRRWPFSVLCLIKDRLSCVHMKIRCTVVPIMQTCPCNEYPITPHFYIVKLGFTGVYRFFLFFLL